MTPRSTGAGAGPLLPATAAHRPVRSVIGAPDLGGAGEGACSGIEVAARRG
jgi:hypothetical protein